MYIQNHLRRKSHQNQAVTINRSSQCIISTNDVPFKDIKQSNDSTFMDFLNDDSAFVTVWSYWQDSKWDESVEYMFFRNNMPMSDKLSFVHSISRILLK